MAHRKTSINPNPKKMNNNNEIKVNFTGCLEYNNITNAIRGNIK